MFTEIMHHGEWKWEWWTRQKRVTVEFALRLEIPDDFFKVGVSLSQTLTIHMFHQARGEMQMRYTFSTLMYSVAKSKTMIVHEFVYNYFFQ